MNFIDNDDLIKDEIINEILNNIQENELNLDFLNNKKSKPASRERQDNINKASRKCRFKQKQMAKLMNDHIDEMHKLILDNNINYHNIYNLINNYNEQKEKITKI